MSETYNSTSCGDAMRNPTVRSPDPRDAELARLREQVRKLMEENNENEQLFNFQHTRTMEADKLWQKAHNKPLVLPDLGNLIGWLLERAEGSEREADAMAEALVHSLTRLNKPYAESVFAEHAEALRLAERRARRKK
jgi:hypothetical protein